jgi:hypothetical protein
MPRVERASVFDAPPDPQVTPRDDFGPKSSELKLGPRDDPPAVDSRA